MCAKAHRKSPCSCFLQWLIAAMAFDIPTNHSPQVAAFDPLPLGKIREEGGTIRFGAFSFWKGERQDGKGKAMLGAGKEAKTQWTR